MTKAREWPNNARHARDRAAEEINVAIRVLDGLMYRIERGEFTRSGLERDLLRIQRHNSIAIRHLESVGAQTLPD